MTGRRPGRFVAGALVLAMFCGVTLASAAPTDANQVIVPNHAGAKANEPVSGSSLPGPLTAIAVLVLAGAGGWLIWRGRAGGVGSFSRTSRQLNVEETRSLGGRQFLVIASYQDKKFLLGVCPGRVDLLASLHDGAPVAEKPKS